MPSTGASMEWRRLAALTINNVDVLVLGETQLDRETGDASGFLNIASDTVLPREIRTRAERWRYRSVGEVYRFWFTDLSEVSLLLGHEAVANGARKLAMGLLRKGKGMTGRFHDYNLADDVFRFLAADQASEVGARERRDATATKKTTTRRPAVKRLRRVSSRTRTIGGLRALRA